MMRIGILSPIFFVFIVLILFKIYTNVGSQEETVSTLSIFLSFERAVTTE